MPMLRPFLSLLLAALASLALPAQVTAYHGVSSATHQAQFTQLSGQGYRMVSLAVAGTISAPTYSAVWEQVGGPAWVASHDLTYTQYINLRSTWLQQGYRPKLLTCAGNSSVDRVFAAVFVADGLTDYFDATVISANSFATTVDAQRAAGRYPVSVDMYGIAGAYTYSAIFEANTSGKVWGYDVDADATEWATTKLAHGEGGERLACLGMSDDHAYVSVWYDERVGTETITASLSSLSWQINFASQTGNGLWPRVIASGGSGAAQRFSGSFAFYRQPLPRQQSTTGVYRSQFAAFDTYMATLLQNEGARAGALAIARDGKLVYARGFTRAEAGYPITQPTDAFRIASCTKPITAIATHQLDEMGLVTMATKPQSVLGLTFSDTRFDDIELRHVLEYTSGIARNYDPWTIATWANQSAPTLPVTLPTGTAWLADQPMLYAPNGATTTYSYSNAAFMLPAEVIRVRTGMTFMTFLQTEVFGPLGINRIRVAPSEYAQLTPADVLHHLTVLDLDPSELHTDRRRRSAQYAQDLNFKRASGGLAASAVDYVRLLSGVFDLRGPDAIVLDDTTLASVLDRHQYAIHNDPGTKNICLAAMSWTDLGGGVYAYTKGGSLENASSVVCWRTDGVSWAAFINKGEAGASTTTLNNLIDGVTTWPNVDEFPNYGLPAFPQRARIDTVLPSVQNNVTAGFFALTGRRFDTVTAVNFGSTVITSQSPTNWAGGYFVVNSPTSMWVYPPQGRQAGSYAISLVNGVGTSLPQNVTLQINASFQMAAPTVVNPGQPWSVYIARGTSSGLTQAGGFGILVLSFSNQPSVVPGFVSLGLGNQFTDYVTSDAFQFSLITQARRFDLPPLPSGTVYLEAVGFDVTAPSLFPLLTTNTTSTTRL